MSLINDALKRAKQAQTENPATPPDLPFRPPEPIQHARPGLPLLPLAALFVVLLLGAGFIFMAVQTRSTVPQVVNATQADLLPAPTPDSAATSPVNPALPTPPDQDSAQGPAQGTTKPATAEVPNDAVAVASAAPEPTKPIVPKLQGIFYHPGRPSAVMNGRTVYVGSRAGEARDFLVLAISRESVTVGNGSQTNVLVLEE